MTLFRINQVETHQQEEARKHCCNMKKEKKFGRTRYFLYFCKRKIAKQSFYFQLIIKTQKQNIYKHKKITLILTHYEKRNLMFSDSLVACLLRSRER